MARALCNSSIGLQHLRCAVAAADKGSFRRAAEFLELRHSVISRSIRQFEYVMGVRLFERSPGGVSLTFAGRSILHVSRTILEQVDTLLNKGRGNGSDEWGQLSIGFSASASTGVMHASLTEFRRRAPFIELAIVEQSHSYLMNALRSRAIDVVISSSESVVPDLKLLPVWSERVLVALPEDHRLARQTVVCWADLLNETLLLGQNDNEEKLYEVLLPKFFVTQDCPKIDRHMVGPRILKKLVSMGLGVTLVAESDAEVDFAGIVYREVQDGSNRGRIEFQALWLEGNENPALRTFLKPLAERSSAYLSKPRL